MLSVVGTDFECPLSGHNMLTQPASQYALTVDSRLADHVAAGVCNTVNGKTCDFYVMLAGQSSRLLGLTGYGLDVKSTIE